jgi:hypothetical protein
MSCWELLCKRLFSLRKDENGTVIIMTLGMFLFLYILCVSVYAISTATEEKMRLQDIADAASYSMSVVQADGLSRLATINRAMSWTYIQMTRRQMDYIVNCWLKKTVANFDEDLEKCKEWNSEACMIPSFKISDGALYIYEPKQCGTHSSGEEDDSNGTCWAGWTPGDNHQIRIGYVKEDESQNCSPEPEQFGKFVSREDLQSEIYDEQTSQKLVEDILQDKMYFDFIGQEEKNVYSEYDDLGIFDIFSLQVCLQTMHYMEDAARTVIKNSVHPDELDDYRCIIEMQNMSWPYWSSVYTPNSVSENNDEQGISVLSPYQNTEEDELEFLSMTTGSASLHDIFGDGIDQWFVRGSLGVLTDDGRVVSPDLKNYTGDGIRRGYKTANRKEVGMQGIKESPVYRANHVTTGAIIGQAATAITTIMSLISCPELFIPLSTEGTKEGGIQKLLDIISNFTNATADMNPSCFNGKKFFAEQCSEIKDNYGLVAEYHWASMRWWCPIETRIQFWPPSVTTTEKDYKLFPLIRCEKHGYDSQDDAFSSHTRDEYRSCVMGLDDVSGIMLNTHKSNNNLNGYITVGHTRIYGDDKEIYNELYTGPRIKPVKLNEKFFRSANIVALAKKRRNPLTAWVGSDDEKLDSGNVIDNSLYALFNMLRKPSMNNISNSDPRWICAVSASRAAYREREISVINRLTSHLINPLPLIYSPLYNERTTSTNSSYLQGRVYQTKYSVLTSDQIDQKDESKGPIHLNIAAADAGGVDSVKKLTSYPYRVGCPHVDHNNFIADRLKMTWNLCETDWDAVFLPIQYNATGYSYSAVFNGLEEGRSKRVTYKQAIHEARDPNVDIGCIMENKYWSRIDYKNNEELDVDILNSHTPSIHYKPSTYIFFKSPHHILP